MDKARADEGVSVAFAYQLAFSRTFIAIVDVWKVKGRRSVFGHWSSDAAVYHIDVVVVAPARVAALLVTMRPS